MLDPKRQLGFGLVEVVMAAAIGTVVLIALTKGMQSLSKSARKVESSTDLSTIRTFLAANVNCEETFQGRPLGNPCGAGGFLELRNDRGDPVLLPTGSRMGPWTVLARCRPGDPSLDVRAARLLSAAPSSADLNFDGPIDKSRFARDEFGSSDQNIAGMEWTHYSWQHPKSRLFPVSSAGLCAHFFSSVRPALRDCGQPNSYITGVDFQTRSLQCAQVPDCAGPNALTFAGGRFVCSNALDVKIDAVIDGLRSGAVQDVNGSSEPQCGSFSNMTCPANFVAIGWRAWVTSSNITSCALRCRRVTP